MVYFLSILHDQGLTWDGSNKRYWDLVKWWPVMSPAVFAISALVGFMGSTHMFAISALVGIMGSTHTFIMHEWVSNC